MSALRHRRQCVLTLRQKRGAECECSVTGRGNSGICDIRGTFEQECLVTRVGAVSTNTLTGGGDTGVSTLVGDGTEGLSFL